SSGGKGGLGSRDAFVNHFRTQADSDTNEFTQGIPQFLRRLNAAEFNSGAPLVDRLAASGASNDSAVESLYLSTLSRRPTTEEVRLMSDYIAKRNDPKRGLQGVLWILLNSGEFVLSH